VRTDVAPSGWTARVEFELVRATAEVMVPRTVRIDDAIRGRTAGQLVVLGAGLDGRAWRLGELADVDVFEIDHPQSQRDKRERVGERPPTSRSLHYVPVDLARDPLADALATAGHRPDAETTWVWEGVVPYLDKADVTATVSAIAERSAPGSALIVNYQTPSVGAGLGRLAARAMTAVARRPSLWRGEPRRSAWTPAAMRSVLTAAGFTVDSDDDLLTIAGTLDLTVRQRKSLRNGRVAVATRN
jgi:methyltransferase (TIGR00027 family)